MLDLIKTILSKKTVEKINDNSRFIWCLVGNIVDEYRFKPDQELKHGTKHFSSNTKVYCFPVKWGDGYEKIKVIGRHRKTNRNVCIVMLSELIKNWRIQKVYRPYILNIMESKKGWTNSEKDKEKILEMLKWLPQSTIKNR